MNRLVNTSNLFLQEKKKEIQKKLVIVLYSEKTKCDTYIIYVISVVI